MSNVTVIGAQWADEGKGKINDWLSNHADMVVRFQGGNNAGHTIVVGDKTYPVTADVQPEATLVRTKVANPDGNADKKKVIGGAIAGAILGQMIGHNTKGTVIGAAAGTATGAAVAKAGEKYEGCLPAGSQFRLTLSSALVMS